MNSTIIRMKEVPRAMRSYCLTLYEIVLESKPKNVIEIGVRQAQSTRSILSAMKENDFGTLTSVDIKNYSYRILEDPDQDLKKYWKLYVGDSSGEEMVNRFKGFECDILFIDGDHSYEGVKKDYINYSPLVKKGGLIILHDVCNINCGVPDFWKELDVPNKITFNWGRAANRIIPGLGIIQV